jgi:hypothetical protein
MPFDVGAVNINPPYVSCMLPLTLPSPAMVDAILAARQPEGVTLPGLMEPFPTCLADQFAVLTLGALQSSFLCR